MYTLFPFCCQWFSHHTTDAFASTCRSPATRTFTLSVCPRSQHLSHRLTHPFAFSTRSRSSFVSLESVRSPPYHGQVETSHHLRPTMGKSRSHHIVRTLVRSKLPTHTDLGIPRNRHPLLARPVCSAVHSSRQMSHVVSPSPLFLVVSRTVYTWSLALHCVMNYIA